jgi:hypothetical protein
MSGFTRNRNNVFQGSNMSNGGLLCQWARVVWYEVRLGTSFQHKLISSCNWISEWNNLSQFQQDSLNNDINSGTCYSGCEVSLPQSKLFSIHGQLQCNKKQILR